MINKVSVKLPSQFLISKSNKSFDNDFYLISINSRIEVEKFEAGTTFENTISYIEDNYLNNIASAAMNLSVISPFEKTFKQLSMNISIEVSTLKPKTTFKNTINEIKYNHLKIIVSVAMNISDITSFEENFDQLSMNSRTEAEKF